MTQRRRVTDRPPLSDIVSRGNLDDRLANINEHVDGLQVLANERWDGHKNQHKDLARSLAEYKASANEWRALVSDFQANYVPKTEMVSEIRRLESLHTTLDGRLDIVERSIQTINDRQVATRGVFSDTRNVLAVIGTVFGAVASGLLIANILLRP